MSTKRYDASAAARRAQAPAPTSNHDATPLQTQPRGRASGPAVPDYELVSVWAIDPAPWQPRLVFNDIEALADSIRGDGQTQGVGILEPLLVRQKAGGRYELIDGERRWRAAKIIAHEQPAGDYLVPVRVFTVSDRVAQLIGQAANGQRDDHKPLEMAICYRRLREALEHEAGKPVGVRTIAGIGWHKHSQVAEYLTIAETLTDEVLRAAGIVDEAGHAVESIVTKLSMKDLLNVAKVEEPDKRVTMLRDKADRAKGLRTGAQAATRPEAPAPTFEERLQQARQGDGYTIRLRGPARAMRPDEALRIARDEMSPALIALVDEGSRDGDGYLAHITDGHVVLVLPREIEQLTAAQLERLTEQVTRLSQRVRRAARFRRRRSSQSSTT